MIDLHHWHITICARKAAVIALCAFALVACGPDESSSAKTNEVVKAPSKPAAAKPADDAPRVVDPMKEGY